MMEVADAWDELLGYFTVARVPIEAVIGDVPALMSAYGMGSYDAVHAATARLQAGAAIVTTDVGFAALPAADTINFTDSGRLARCRELRAP
jgi:predicted nucleic acid-binding protein